MKTWSRLGNGSTCDDDLVDDQNRRNRHDNERNENEEETFDVRIENV